MRIVIETIPHSEQRYPTTGDWQMDREGENLLVRVSALGDWRMEALIGIHEPIEALLCRHAGVTQAEVDAFDNAFEGCRLNEVFECPAQAVKRIPGHLHNPEDEPGDCPDAPYHDAHQIATGVERILAVGLGVKWSEYAEASERLYER